MRSRILFVIAVLFVGCGNPPSQSGTQTVSPTPDSAAVSITPMESNQAKDGWVSNEQKADSTINCHDLLHSLIDKSSYDPDIKKFGFGVWVDTVYNGIAMIEITTHNTERNDDPIIGWVKIDFNAEKLWDVSLDPAKELSYDTVLFRELDYKCLVR